jgi:hypothetical protein
MTLAKSAQVFLAAVRFARQSTQVPVSREFRCDPIPQQIEFDRLMRWPGETEKIRMNKFRPFLHQSRVARATAFELQSKDGGMQWSGIERHHDRGAYVGSEP